MEPKGFESKRVESKGFEVKSLESKGLETGYASNAGGYTAVPEGKSEASSMHDKEALLRLAKKNVQEKRNLVKHYIFYIVTFFVLGALNDGDISYTGGGIWLGFTLTEGAHVLLHTAKFFWARIRKGALLKRDPVEEEYNRLKRMEPSRIEAELERL
jgi:hypothetical protein